MNALTQNVGKKNSGRGGCQPHVRFGKFSLVGLIGFGAQITVLGMLTRAGVNYLVATTLAVESAILHNFFWHQCFTWADRGRRVLPQTLRRLLRFHLSNGVISLLGNLVLMRLLVGSLGWPVIAANLVTVMACSLANFLASDEWVFAGTPAAEGWERISSASDSGAVAHQQKRALRERNVDQRRGGGQGKSNPDLWGQQEWRQRPQTIQNQDGDKEPLEPAAQIFQVERNAGEQIKPNRNADNGRDHQGRGDPARPAEHLLEKVFDPGQARQRRNVEAEIHHLDQEEQPAHVVARNMR